ncbi:MAG: ATP-dependent RecD-like DNA helicase [Gemmataceae bacterium]
MMPVVPTRRFDLTQEQLDAIAHLMRLPKTVQTLGGYAGTGKTTVIKRLVSELADFKVCAYTGKAAHVLRRKGVPASTIHSLVYVLESEDEKGRPRWRLADDLKGAGGVIVDEASMVSEGIYNDLLTFEVPLIFVGDHGQLEPVERSNGQPFNLMAQPDVVLETIHRNAGEIARFAEWVRQGNRPADWARQPGCTGKAVRFRDIQQHVTDDELLEVDQCIVAMNQTRVSANRIARERLGRRGDGPAVGDRVMCLQNDKLRGLFNGQQGTIVSLHNNDEMTFEAEEGRRVRVPYMPDAFHAVKKPPRDRHGRLPFDYCWAATCHKCQGSEWDDVLVIEERCPAWDHARWAYTAASRARKRVDWCEL